MADKRKIEVFSAGCSVCHEVIDAVRREAGSSDEVIVHDMKDMQVIRRAQGVGHSLRSRSRNRWQIGVLLCGQRC